MRDCNWWCRMMMPAPPLGTPPSSAGGRDASGARAAPDVLAPGGVALVREAAPEYCLVEDPDHRVYVLSFGICTSVSYIYALGNHAR